MNKPTDQHPLFLTEQNTLLAAERTYSAWVRTGLAFVGGGLAVGKALPQDNPLAHTLAIIAGLLLVLVGLMVFFFAARDYHRVCSRLAQFSLKPRLLPFIGLVTGLLFISTAIIFFLILA